VLFTLLEWWGAFTLETVAWLHFAAVEVARVLA